MQTITIKKNDFDEFEVLTTPANVGIGDGIYFCTDKEDAIDTAHEVFGADIQIKFRSGTYCPQYDD